MTTRQRTILVIAVLIVSGILVYFIWVNRKRKNTYIGNETTLEVLQQDESLDTNKVLKLGVQGEEVKELQRLINKALQQSVFSLAYLNIDGDFGPYTENASVQVFGLDQITLTDAYNMSTNILNIY